MNLANKITIIRILLIPFFIAFVLYGKWEIAFIIFVIAALSDGVDGYAARRYSQRTEFGKVLDPIADKLLILSAFICLGVAPGLPAGQAGLPQQLKLPLYVPIVIISRDAIIVLGALIIFLIRGNLEIKPTAISKITTFFQMATVISVLLRLTVSPILWNVAVGFTVFSGVDYVIRGTRLLNANGKT